MLRLKKGGSLPNLVGIALMLLATVATAQTTVADRPVVLDSARLVAGESKPIQWPLRDTPINSVISVRLSPELAFPIRINLGANGSLPFQLIVPPTTPPGEYELEITGQADNGRPLSANLHLTVGAVVVPKTVTARPPVILLNGVEILCDANSTGTFDQMAALLEAESVPVLFFNN